VKTVHQILDMTRPIFVTGIGTNVGKTVVAAILTKLIEGDYWKPIQAGLPRDTSMVTNLLGGRVVCHSERYSLKSAVSPHYAAEIDDLTIDIENFHLPKTIKPLVIEGAGGLLVPINKHTLMFDLIKRWKTQIILVIRHYLGSINHSLLTIEYLRYCGYPISAVIFNAGEDASSEKIIFPYLHCPCARIPIFNSLTAREIRCFLDQPLMFTLRCSEK